MKKLIAVALVLLALIPSAVFAEDTAPVTEGSEVPAAPLTDDAVTGAWLGQSLVYGGFITPLSDFGIRMTLGVAPDGTAVLDYGSGAPDTGTWTFADGLLTVTIEGSEVPTEALFTLTAEGTLTCELEGMTILMTRP